MKHSDPDQVCLETLKSGIDFLNAGDQAGVVAYSLDAENTFNLREIRDDNDKNEIKQFAQNVLTRQGVVVKHFCNIYG